MKNLTIHEIEALTEKKVKELTQEKERVKGHEIYFVDFGGHFGYSALVFADGQHIKYANDYELHHPEKTKEELKALYVNKLNRVLFTEEELCAPIGSYDEYRRKKRFIHNYYAMRRPHISIFGVRDKGEEKAYQRLIKNMYYDPIAFAYLYDAQFVNRHIEIYKALEKQKDKHDEDYAYCKSAFLEEMYNHEYGINWQGDFDVISAFANVTFREYNSPEKTLINLFNEAEFTETQKRAYLDAREEYYRAAA